MVSGKTKQEKTSRNEDESNQRRGASGCIKMCKKGEGGGLQGGKCVVFFFLHLTPKKSSESKTIKESLHLENHTSRPSFPGWEGVGERHVTESCSSFPSPQLAKSCSHRW